MDSAEDTFGIYNEHCDDPVFMDYLLNHHAEIIDEKEDLDKILYSMEISRLLGRVAVHERCEAESEGRDRDNHKYEIYHKTALYVARKGIDIGTKHAYEVHSRGGNELDIVFNHHMGWLFAQYAMMLLETQRYSAAMGAVINAENYLIHDYYRIANESDPKKLIEELRKIPFCKSFKFNYSAKQLKEMLPMILNGVMQGLKDAIIEKKLRILYKIYKEVPSKYEYLYKGFIVGHLDYFFKKDKEACVRQFGEVIMALKDDITKTEKGLELPELSIKNCQLEVTDDQKDYDLWVISGNLALSYLEFVPDITLRSQYVCDDLEVDFQDPEMNLMMDDVMETFEHCRFEVYLATSYEAPIASLAYLLSPKAKRIYNQEVLLDTYPRLYSVLDKLSHIVMKSFGITLMPSRVGEHPQPSYRRIVKTIRDNSGKNPYLLTLCEIFDEINPRVIYNKRKDLPFYTMLPEAEHMDRIRHHIIHSGVALTVEDSGMKSNCDIAYITEKEFSTRCLDLLKLVKEAIMNTALAIEYKSKHQV